jgi:type VI secretion system secreted protein VgrG
MLSLLDLPRDDERLLRLGDTPSTIEAALVPLQATLHEAVNQGFTLVLELLAVPSPQGLRALVGEALTLRLKQADGRYAPWHGCVAQAVRVGRAGALERWRLVLRPWLHWLALRQDSFVYQECTALQIVESVFADYPAACWRTACSEATLRAMRVRELCIQYRESDFAFVTRLLAQEGLCWFFEQVDEGNGAGGSAAARHELVIADARHPGADLGPLRFAAQHPTAFLPSLEDPVTDLLAVRRAVANAVALGSWDPARLAGIGATLESTLALGALPRLQRYDGAGVDRHEDNATAAGSAAQALSALALDAKRFNGTSGVRRLGAGRRFTLIDHPSYGANTSALSYAGTPGHRREEHEFRVLAVEHRAANNLGAAAARALGCARVERGAYRNRFQAVLGCVPLVPRAPRRPTAPAVLGARVVGLRGTELTSDRDHRVKLQFHFQRGRAPNPGGLPHVSRADPEGHAPGDERNGAWVRVLGPAAGASWGSVHTPRIGAEVAVEFLDGDIDRPVVAGGLYHGADAPPFAAGCDAGMNHAGALSGLHSRGLGGEGFNQWVLDDSRGQLRMRLHAGAAGSELGLGHLIQQGPQGAWRGAWRGSGFEGCTQGWASVRAGAGLLLSTQGRAGTYGSAQGTQMDTTEALAQWRAARERMQGLGTAARAVQTPGLRGADDGQALARLIEALDPAQQGRHPVQVNGQPALQPAADGRGAGTQPVPALAEPLLLLDTPAAALLASEASVSAWAGGGHSLAAQGDLHLAAAATCAQACGGTAGVYAHAGGLTVRAAHGPVSLRAHTDALRLLADQALTVTAVDGELRISAQQRVRLVAGSSALTLDGADIEVATPGIFTVRGATHEFLGAGQAQAELPFLPEARIGENAR